jgi:DNA polymerase-3 subunit epsilon
LRYVVLDTELTSLEHRTNRLLSIGAIAMQGASIRLGEQFYRVVNPQCAIPAEGVVIHQLRGDDVQAGADLMHTLDEFRRFVAGAVLVGHFTHIDIRILRKEMAQTGHAINNPAIDTARVHHWLLRRSPYMEDLPLKLEKLGLATIAQSYGVKVDAVHHALADAFLTAQLWQKLQHALRANSVNTLKKLLKIASV